MIARNGEVSAYCLPFLPQQVACHFESTVSQTWCRAAVYMKADCPIARGEIAHTLDSNIQS